MEDSTVTVPRQPTLADLERVLGKGDGDLAECAESRRIVGAAGHDPDDRAAIDKLYQDALWRAVS